MHRAQVLLLFATAAMLRGQSDLHFASGGWRVHVDPQHTTLDIAAEPGGEIITDAHLQFRTPNGLVTPGAWTVVRKSESIFEIQTAGPSSAWRFCLSPAVLQISSTRADAVIAGSSPGGDDRMPVRLIDRQGPPVTWSETMEVVGSFGGSRTQMQSYLPRRNPDVMYLALGPVSSPVFHAIFERTSDTALDFPENTLLARSAGANSFSVTIPVPVSTLIRVIPDYYKGLGLPFYTRFDDSVFKSAPMVWSSWTSYYSDVREEDITRNADWFAANLKPYGFEYVQLDDGYDRGNNGEHSWIVHWDPNKFPHGPEWLTGYIHSKGLKAGLWLVPNSYAAALEQHPEWYLRDKEGKPIIDYSTPALDSSRPEVLDLLKHIFQTLDNWGFDYYKFDGEVALPKYDSFVDVSRLYHKEADPVEVFRHRMAVIRDVLGPDRFIEECPAGSPLDGIGFVNSYFTGEDLYNTWGGMHPLFSSINATGFLNHIVSYLMPGEGLELGPTRGVEAETKNRPPAVVRVARTRENDPTTFGTTDEEARTLVTYVSLTGVAYPLASVMPELPAERIALLKKTMPTLPILPADLFSRGTDYVWDTFKREKPDYYVANYPEILDLKVNTSFGAWDVVALTNWGADPVKQELSLHDKLGLAPDTPYAVFDFWNQNPLGVITKQTVIPIAPHDTRVLLIRPAESHPQLIGISRHISGAYSVKDLNWDGNKRALTGTVDALQGDPYTIWVRVPAGFKLANVKASSGGAALQTTLSHKNDSVGITFQDANGAISWTASF